MKDTQENKYKISPRYAVHRQKLDNFIKKGEQLTTPPVNASMKKENGKFTYVEDLPGKAVDISATKDALIGRLFMIGTESDIAIEAVTHITPASYTVEALKGEE